MGRTVYRRRHHATRRVRAILQIVVVPPAPSEEAEHVGFHRDLGRLMNR
jgi:hypothetical protein